MNNDIKKRKCTKLHKDNIIKIKNATRKKECHKRKWLFGQLMKLKSLSAVI